MNKQTESRYHRQMLMRSIGASGQKRLSEARVLCVGAGGLGSTLLYALAAAGTGRLGIADDDRVATTDLNRQFLYQERDIGAFKADLAAERLRLLNSEIEVATHKIRISPTNSEALMQDYDYLVDCADNQLTSLLLNDWSYHLGKVFIFASISQFSGMFASFSSQRSPCLRCWYRILPERGQDCAVDGVIGSVAAVFGAMQANEVIKAIVYGEDALNNRIFLLDTLANKIQPVEISKDQNCPACNHKSHPETKSLEISGEEITTDQWSIIDIRIEDDPPLPSSIRLKSNEVITSHDQWDKNQKLLIICQRGISSLTLVKQLRQLDHQHAYSLAGGALGQQFTELMERLCSSD